jgi:hypothetical protein
MIMPIGSNVYCIYTDSIVSADDANRDHIVPLSLGGADGFEILACREFNSRTGSELEGAMANDFLIAMERTRYDARGHSGRRPVALAKHARYGPGGRPAQVKFRVHEGFQVWDAIERRVLHPAETYGMRIKFRTELNVDLRSRFVAKVGLGAGYLAYGEVFRRCVRHNELRAVLNWRNGDDADCYRHHTIRIDDPLLTPKPDEGTQLGILRGICNSTRGSIVMLVPTSRSLMIVVGVLGKFVGMLNVAADTTAFPNNGAYSWGHVALLREGVLRRGSFRSLLKGIARLAPAQVDQISAPEHSQ